jgi:hypothetical protein
VRLRLAMPLLALATCAAAQAAAPSRTALGRHPGPFCRDRVSAVVERGADRWRAVGCFWLSAKGTRGNTSVEVDRWKGEGWVAQAEIPIPLGGPWNFIHGASLTHGEAPDFVASAGGGADWLPLAIVARLNGRWQLVRFDSPDLLGTHLVVDSQAPARFGLIHSTVDACGCAAGPQTSTWYRLRRPPLRTHHSAGRGSGLYVYGPRPRARPARGSELPRDPAVAVRAVPPGAIRLRRRLGPRRERRRTLRTLRPAGRAVASCGDRLACGRAGNCPVFRAPAGSPGTVGAASRTLSAAPVP